MSDEVFYSEKLGLNYKKKYDKEDNQVIVFEDNVNYRMHELYKIKDFPDTMLKKIHMVKNIFQGVVVE